jgi:AcrR family transcriptional regulator
LSERFTDSQTPTSRRERRKLEVRGRILEASYTLFERRGIDATTVSEICERADVAQKTFFNHFGSKQDLLREIAEDALIQLIADIDSTRGAAGGTGGRIESFFARVARESLERGPMHRELLNEMVQLAHTAGTDTEQARLLNEAFAAIVDEGLAAGDVTRRHDARTLTEMITGAFYALMLSWGNQPDYPLRERAEAAGRFLADALAPRDDERSIAGPEETT